MDSRIRRRNIAIFIAVVLVIILVIVIVIAATGNNSSNNDNSSVPPPTENKSSTNIGGDISDILVTSDQKTVIAIRDQGVIAFVDSKTEFKLPSPPNAAADVTSAPSCLAEISANVLAIGTEDGCIYQFNRDSGAFKLVIDNSDKIDSVDGFSNMAIYKALTVASNGQLYAANYSSGVVEVYDTGSFAFVGNLSVTSGLSPIGLAFDASGKLLTLCLNLSTGIGVVLQNQNALISNINKPVSMKACATNKLQIATSGSVISYNISTLAVLGTVQIGDTISALSCSQVAQNGNLISY